MSVEQLHYLEAPTMARTQQRRPALGSDVVWSHAESQQLLHHFKIALLTGGVQQPIATFVLGVYVRAKLDQGLY